MPTKRIALLLDIGFGSLRASARSAARMAGCLAARGFVIHTRTGAEVTRANVEQTLRSLHKELADGDAFVLYFVGHGDKVRGVAAPAPAGRPPASTEAMLLITHDLRLADATLPGIAGPELTRWLAPLIRRTGNVTLILDCCRAATLVPGELPDAATDARITEILADATRALRDKYRAHRDDAPAFVRLVATTRNESAVEYESDGGRIGVFTDALAQLLDRHPDDDLSWDQLLPSLQAAVQAECETQYPGVEGPRHRLPFSRREQPVPGEYPCRASDLGWLADAGALHGIEVGDRFDLLPDGVVALRVDPHATHLEVTGAPRPGVQRTRRIGCARPQVIRCDHVPAIAAPELRFTTDDDPDAIATITAETLRERDDIIHVGAHGLIDAARRLARWRRQAPVFADLTAHTLAHVTWGITGETSELPHEGVTLPAGTRVWLKAQSAEAPTVQVSLFRLRADRHLVHLDDELDHGVSVARNTTTDLSPRTGLMLTWSPRVPADGLRDEALYLLVSTRPRSFHRVGTSPGRARAGAPPAVTRGVTRGPELAVVRLAYRLSPSA